MKTKLFLTRRLPEPVMKKLSENFDLPYNEEDRVLSKDEIIENVKWCEILLCLLTDAIDKDVIAANPNLKGIVNYAAGFNNIDLAEATKRGIPVTNTPGVLSETTADLAFTLICSIARRIVEADSFTRAGKFKGWEPELLLGSDIHHKTLGLIGAGKIGSQVAKRATGFEMKILYNNMSVNKELESTTDAKFVELPHLLKQSDFISIHVPLTDKTHHMIGKKELALMKEDAYLINTSRGAVIDEEALVNALKLNQIAGAALDVYESEPQIHPELINLSNVILLPHIGSASKATRVKMGMLAADNAVAISEGKIPPNIVNKEIYNRGDL